MAIRPALFAGPRMIRRHRLGWLALASVPCLSSGMATAQSETDANSLSRALPAEDRTAASPTRKPQILFAPVPLSNPATGTGLAAGAIAFYNPNAAPQQWISAGGIIYTSRGTRGVGAFHSMSFDKDRLRFSASLSYIDDRNDYYGIGAAAGDDGIHREIDSKQFNIDLQALMRVFPRGYAGIRYRLRTTDARLKEAEAESLPAPPPDAMNSNLSAIGPSFAYDTRDSATQPHRGVMLSANWLFGLRALGDSYSHDKLQMAANSYLPIGAGTVIALRGALCAAGGNAPYYDLCLFGANNDLRGYVTGRYRDKASWATQAEWRQHVSGRWGATAFVGLGGIAPSAGTIIDKGKLLPAGGIGLRYRPFRSNDVQLRVDLAAGKDDHAIYVGIAEAF
ncbi:BamA/TamA family outer membrane protein [Sphingobium sp. DN12]|uniref:BamA/TamA family outer membrane protein n=1 Tax=Sphingobium sp. DN12 TaxID=3378073 RepID=UPI003DA29F46